MFYMCAHYIQLAIFEWRVTPIKVSSYEYLIVGKYLFLFSSNFTTMYTYSSMASFLDMWNIYHKFCFKHGCSRSIVWKKHESKFLKFPHCAQAQEHNVVCWMFFFFSSLFQLHLQKSQYGNVRLLLLLRFYVKSILWVNYVKNCHFHIFGCLEFWK